MQQSDVRISALNNLAVAKDRAGKSAEAVEHDEESLAIRRRILPPGHHYIALSLGNLAIHMDNSGRNKDALPLHAQAVAIYRALPPPGKQGELAAEMNNWGLGCYYLGDMPCAIDKMLQATAIWSKELPADHGNLLTARTNLAALYSRSGMLREGEAQLRQAMGALETAAKRSPNAAVLIGLSSARNELTDNLLAQQRYPEALQVARQRLRDVQGGADMDEAAVMALRGVDFTVTSGELIVLLGPSGSGKSTLLNILGGLDRPTAGKAFFRDLDLATASEARKELDAAIAILSEKAAWLPELAELKRLR